MNYCDQKNITFMMIHRSGGSTVKRIIPVIQQRCAEATEAAVAAASAAASAQCGLTDPDSKDCSIDNEATNAASVVPTKVSAPEEECYLLAQWAVDSYYQVVIGANGGLDALVRALECFPHHALVQEYACTALAHLCRRSSSSADEYPQQAMTTATAARVVPLLLQSTLPIHAGSSVAVVAAACEALSVLAPVWLANNTGGVSSLSSSSSSTTETSRYREDVVSVLRNVQGMYLHPHHKRTAEQLLTAFF
jgi:Armadillo/beta-catenin-like repeat